MKNTTEIAKGLREQVQTVEMMAYALKLMLPGSATRIEADAHCVCEWIKDACVALTPAQREDTP